MNRTGFISMTLAVAAAAATVTFVRSPKAEGELRTIVFDNREQMLSATITAVRVRNGDNAAAIAAKEFANAQICFIPGQHGDPDRIFRIIHNLGPQEERGFRIAVDLHGFGGSWGHVGARGAFREVSCIVMGRLGSKREGFAAGEFHPLAGISRSEIESRMLHAADTAYHENRHKVFSSMNKGRWAELVKQGGDAIFWHMLDEGDAYARTFLAFAQRHLLTGNEIEKGALEEFLREKSPDQFRFLEELVSLYGKDELKNYLRAEGKFPAAFHRIFLVLAMNELADTQAYRSMAAHYDKQFKGKGVTMTDAHATELMRLDGNVFGDMTGILALAQKTPLMQARPTAMAKAPKRAETKFGLNEPHATLFRIVQFLEQAGGNEHCLGALPYHMGDMIKMVQTSTHIRNPYIAATMDSIFQMTIDKVTRHPDMKPELKEDVIALVAAMRGAAVKGDPVNPALLGKPLRGLAPTQTSNCG